MIVVDNFSKALPFKACMYDLTRDEVKTQKARGIYDLQPTLGGGVYLTSKQDIRMLPQNGGWLGLTSSTSGYFFWRSQPFARPCPISPRHGFVESRSVGSWEEAKALFEEARKEDPEAELILMPRLTGLYSGVATAQGVTWGLGNAGVTSGDAGATYLIPCPGCTRYRWVGVIAGKNMHKQHMLEQDAPNSAYLELVEHKGNVHCVQFRDGPEQPTTKNFIPQETVVQTILKPEKDLLEWERTIKKYKGQPGVVVQMSTQDALSSHHAVHAISLGIPVVRTRRLEKGDILEPEGTQPTPLTLEEYQKLAHHVEKWMRINPYDSDIHSEASNFLRTATASIHAQHVWDNAPHLLQFRAMAVPLLLKYIIAASIGELRHWTYNGPGRDSKGGETMKTILPTEVDHGGVGRMSRGQIYEAAMDSLDPRKFLPILKTVVEDFSNPGWGSKIARRGRRTGDMQYGYGGPKWADVAQSGVTLSERMDAFLIHPNAETWAEVILAANKAVHSVHNGGYVLSKWVTNKEFDHMGLCPAYGFMNNVAARMALGQLGPEGVKA